MRHLKALVAESVGYTQVRFYPECPVCGWYPAHVTTHLEAARIASEHNAARHPDVAGPISTTREDVHKPERRKAKA